MNNIVLFVTHRQRHCGVYEFGDNVFQAISSSSRFQFIKSECESLAELKEIIGKLQPSAIIYNYHPDVLPWLCTKISKGLYRNNIAGIEIPQIGIIHEVTQHIADTATGYVNKWIIGRYHKRLNSIFNFYIAPDPTLLLKNPLVFKTGRLISEYRSFVSDPEVITIGSFGFATPKKGFEKIVQKAQQEFDEAIIRINMPSADFGDTTGSNAREIARNCQNLITKPGIRLEVTHEFMNKHDLLNFLASNSMNVFLYEDVEGRGISSAVDNALAVEKPIAVSRCPMFRHILNAKPSVCADDIPLKQILHNGFSPLKKISKGWDKENLVWEYERIINTIFERINHPVKNKKGIIKTIASAARKILTMPDSSFTWLRNTDSATTDDLSSDPSITYKPVALGINDGFNRILNNQARKLYEPAIKKLFELAPETMSKKITEANVQQGFVFDTTYRFIKEFKSPKILCVGSYEDTASMALQKMGYDVEDIDPMTNYFLQEFYTKPSTIKSSYDIIFSTSVIEHDPDDEIFIKCIAGLLTTGGIAIITCDYKDGWKEGEPKPEVDARFYTKHDLENRLLSYIPDCELVDTPEWDCPHPDFNYLGKYQYSFASFTIRKK